MRKIILIITILACFSPLMARSYFSSFPAAYNVDLADPNKEYVGTDTGNWDSTGYNDRTLVAQAGFADTTQPVQIDITFGQNGWMYQSASQPNLHRPFGLDIIVRQRFYRDGCDMPHGQTDETVAIYHYGYQDGSSGNGTSITLSSYNSSTDGSEHFGGVWPDHDRPSNHDAWDMGLRHDLIGAWVEFVLVLPEINPNDSSYMVGSANDYYASFDITLSGGAVGSWHCEFTGYYDDPSSDNVEFTLNVIPLANASAIDLDNPALISPGSAGLPVAQYWYSTTRNTSREAQDCYAFVSSSSLPTSNGGSFSLVRQGTDGGFGNEIGFEIGLASDDTSKGVKWFNGTSSITGNISPDEAFYSSRTENMQDIDGAWIYQRYDDGTMRFRLTDSNTTSLNAGVYSSYIYFHVVVDA